MAQRYPDSFDGIFSRVPVLNWTLLQHVGTRDGIALMGDGWLRPAQVKLVHDAVLAACDAQDGIADGLVADPVGCKKRFNIAKLQCAAGASGDQCLSEAQVNAVKTLGTNYRLPFPLANGVRDYPGRGPSVKVRTTAGRCGGSARRRRRYHCSRDQQQGLALRRRRYPVFLCARSELRRAQVQREGPRQARAGGVRADGRDQSGSVGFQEARRQADHASSTWPTTRRAPTPASPTSCRWRRRWAPPRSVPSRASTRLPASITRPRARAPANVDMLKVLTDWVEHGKAPGNLVVTQQDAGEPGRDRALAAAVPVAAMAAVQERRCEEGGEFCLREVRGCPTLPANPHCCFQNRSFGIIPSASAANSALMRLR